MSDVKAASRQKDKRNDDQERGKNGRSLPRLTPAHAKELFATGPAASLRGPVPAPLTVTNSVDETEQPAPEPMEPQTTTPEAALAAASMEEEPASPETPVAPVEELAAAETAVPPAETPEPAQPPTAKEEPAAAAEAESKEPAQPHAEKEEKPATAEAPKTEETAAAKVGEEPVGGEETAAAPSLGGPTETPAPAAEAEAKAEAKPEDEKKEEKPAKEEKKKKEEGAPPEGEKEAVIERAPISPEEDPAFQQTMAHVKRTRKKQRQHQPPAAKTDEVKKAAVLPENEQQAKNDRQAHLETMNQVAKAEEKEDKPFKPETFKQLLQDNLKKIEKTLPKSESAAKRFKREKPLEQVRQDINAQVKAENQKVAAPIASQVRQKEPPASGLPTQAPQELQEELPGQEPRPISSQAAAPKPKTNAEISMQQESQSLDDKMAEHNMTEEQLANSNEPTFLQALDTKKQAQQEAAAAPGRYREQEQQILDTARRRAGSAGSRGFGGMFGERGGAFGHVFAKQQNTESDDETKQKLINKRLDGIYNQTKQDVDEILAKLTEAVDTIFAQEVEAAQKAFESRVESQLDDIYGITVIDDWLFGEDTEAIEEVFENEKALFVSKMNTALNNIAGRIARDLNAAIRRIKYGRQETQTFYDSLDETQKKLAKESMDFYKAQYDNLEDSVHEKEQELAYTLAESYQKNVADLRNSFDKIKDEVSKGWIGKAVEFVVSVGKAIAKLASLLWSVISRIGQIIGDIIAHPIRFLENLAAGIKSGFQTFVKDIDSYLVAGFFDWLRGSIGGGKIQIPETLDAAGLFSLTTQLLDLNYDTFREIAVRKFGEKPVAALEKGVEVAEKGLELFQIARSKGLGALWEHVKTMIVDQLDAIFEKVKETVLYETIKKALTHIAAMFTPVGAFIKAAQTLYRGLRFLVDNIDRIAELVNAFLDSLELAVQGNVAGIAKRVIQALQHFIVIAIDFLAKLLGLGKLADKVRRIIRALRKPIIRAMEWLLDKLKPVVRRIFGVGKAVIRTGKRGAAKIKAAIFYPIKRFSVGTKPHTIEVQQRASGDTIIVRSTPKSIPRVVKDARQFLKKNPDPTLSKEVDKLADDYAAWRRMSIDTEAARRKKSQAYLAIFKLTAKVLKATDSDVTVPISSIKWGSLDSRGRATSVTADPLTIKGPKGGTPSETIPGWNTKHEKSEIRAHLLHDKLHGPGKRFNLTPTSRSINRIMFEKVEKPALDALGIKPKNVSKQNNIMLTYSTRVHYSTTDPSLRDSAKSVEMEAKAKDIGTKKEIDSWNMPKTDNYP